MFAVGYVYFVVFIHASRAQLNEAMLSGVLSHAECVCSLVSWTTAHVNDNEYSKHNATATDDKKARACSMKLNQSINKVDTSQSYSEIITVDTCDTVPSSSNHSNKTLFFAEKQQSKLKTKLCLLTVD